MLTILLLVSYWLRSATKVRKSASRAHSFAEGNPTMALSPVEFTGIGGTSRLVPSKSLKLHPTSARRRSSQSRHFKKRIKAHRLEG